MRDTGSHFIQPPGAGFRSAPRAFTLVELLVVMFIIALLVGITIPAINRVTKGSNQKQAVNLVTALIANARNAALSTGRQAGLVFYEESTAGVSAPNKNQTAVAVCIEDPNQSQYSPASGNTVFIPLPGSTTGYVPAGVRVATLDDGADVFRLAQNSTGQQSRVILFNNRGQMELVNGLAVPASGAQQDTSAAIAQDWNFAQPSGGNSVGVSSPGVIIYDGKAFDDANPTNIPQWLQANADILIVNAYTGNIIR